MIVPLLNVYGVYLNTLDIGVFVPIEKEHLRMGCPMFVAIDEELGLESCQSQHMIWYKPVILCMFVIIYLVKSQIPCKGSDYQLYMPNTHTKKISFAKRKMTSNREKKT